jgi:hypothetical protein
VEGEGAEEGAEEEGEMMSGVVYYSQDALEGSGGQSAVAVAAELVVSSLVGKVVEGECWVSLEVEGGRAG